MKTELHKAAKANALNQVMSELWQAEATHTKVDFETCIVPMYVNLLRRLKADSTTDSAENLLLELIKKTTAACHYRWSLRLPLNRPGSDYRQYEIIYTYALITAMAVDELRTALGWPEHTTLDELAGLILSNDDLTRLKADPLVWEDWLGYFDQSELGGLYGVSIGNRNWRVPNPVTTRREETSPLDKSQKPSTSGVARNEPPTAGSGRALLSAIREGLQDGSLTYNQPRDVVQVDRDGRTFLEYPAVIEWGIDRLTLDVDVKRMKNRFDRLKVIKRTPEGRQLFRGKLRARDPRVRGYVLEEHAELWPEPPPPGRFVIENLTTRD